MTWIASRSVFSVVGVPLVTRTAESPRPMPQIVRLPYISLRVANSGGGDRPVAGRRVGHHRPDHDLAGLGEDLAVDDVRLLPEQVRVEGPDVAEPVLLGQLGELRPCARPAGWSAVLLRSPSCPCRPSTMQVLARPRLTYWPSPLRAEVLVVVDDDLAAGEHGVDVTVDLEALPGGVVHVHVVGLAHADRWCARSGRRRRCRRRRPAG